MPGPKAVSRQGNESLFPPSPIPLESQKEKDGVGSIPNPSPHLSLPVFFKFYFILFALPRFCVFFGEQTPARRDARRPLSEPVLAPKPSSFLLAFI